MLVSKLYNKVTHEQEKRCRMMARRCVYVYIYTHIEYILAFTGKYIHTCVCIHIIDIYICILYMHFKYIYNLNCFSSLVIAEQLNLHNC